MTASTIMRSGRASLQAGSAIVGLVVLVAVLAPVIATHDPIALDLRNGLKPPSPENWLGTDQLGRDIWSRLVHAAAVDLRISFVAAAVPFAIGSALGSVAAYIGGALDWALMRIVDSIMAFPFYLVVLLVVFVAGAGETGIYIAFALVGWAPYARVIGVSTRKLKREAWVVAAESAGVPPHRVLFGHILPNTITQAVILFISDMIFVIVAVVTLSYLGLGIQPPTPDWGTMIGDGQPFVTTLWWIPVIPGLAVMITGIGLSLIADGLAQIWRRS